MANKSSTEKIIQLLENQLSVANQQNQDLSKQIESLTQQVQYLTKLLYGSKTEKSKYNTPDGQEAGTKPTLELKKPEKFYAK